MLDAAQADKFARLALAGLDREYPNKPGEVLTATRICCRPHHAPGVFRLL